MAQQDEDIAAIDLATWFTRLEAANYAAMVLGPDGAFDAIWERLKGGMITAISTTSSSTVQGQPPVARGRPAFVSDSWWDYFRDGGKNNFWQSGDARFFIRASHQRALPLTVRCFGIKLNPDNVRATLPPLPLEQPEHSGATIEQDETEPSLPVRGPPVPDALLDGWHELYRRAYQGSTDTIENALKSAQGMFPGKFVSRDRVRKLVGGRKRGRKIRDQTE